MVPLSALPVHGSFGSEMLMTGYRQVKIVLLQGKLLLCGINSAHDRLSQRTLSHRRLFHTKLSHCRSFHGISFHTRNHSLTNHLVSPYASAIHTWLVTETLPTRKDIFCAASRKADEALLCALSKSKGHTAWPALPLSEIAPRHLVYRTSSQPRI